MIAIGSRPMADSVSRNAVIEPRQNPEAQVVDRHCAKFRAGKFGHLLSKRINSLTVMATVALMTSASGACGGTIRAKIQDRTFHIQERAGARISVDYRSGGETKHYTFLGGENALSNSRDRTFDNVGEIAFISGTQIDETLSGPGFKIIMLRIKSTSERRFVIRDCPMASNIPCRVSLSYDDKILLNYDIKNRNVDLSEIDRAVTAFVRRLENVEKAK